MKTTLAAAFAAGLLATTAHAQSTCPLTQPGAVIKHVVFLQFDNTHLLRDFANVPSDVEQMPHLYNFLTQNGTLGANNHTQLISHTANGILNTITGVYGDRLGSSVSNSFDYFTSNGRAAFTSTFGYWTDPLQTRDTGPGADTTPLMIAETGKNAPAPWVGYTRAGCDFGAVALANTVVENVGADLVTLFGANSPQVAESKANRAQAVADFEGLSVHCAQGSTFCGTNTAAVADLLPDEPGGYTGFKAVHGHQAIVPALPASGGTGNLPNLLGGTIPGFPGFDGMFPKVTGAYVASMLEAGIPVVYGYLSDAHDDHTPGTSHPYGPGEAGFVAQLKDYDAGWAAFFTRLAKSGIDQTNTLFVITVEEGDIFAGDKPTDPSCDGVTKPCTYNRIGEVAVDIERLLATQSGYTQLFDVHRDMAPNFYVYGAPGAINRSAEDPLVRQLELAAAALTVADPYYGRTIPLTVALADRVEQDLLHMGSADPLRVPHFTDFAEQNVYASAFQDVTPCTAPVTAKEPACVAIGPGFAWQHGGQHAKIAQTWLGLVGPGVRNLGLDTATWTDHVDVRPTMLSLIGIRDDYLHDGRVITEELDTAALPASIGANLDAYNALTTAYKQLTAPFGRVAKASLVVSTAGVKSPTLSAYQAYEAKLGDYATRRNATAGQIRSLIEGAAFGGAAFDPAAAGTLTTQANALITEMDSMAAAAR